jgi:hypothetical protein
MRRRKIEKRSPLLGGSILVLLIAKRQQFVPGGASALLHVLLLWERPLVAALLGADALRVLYRKTVPALLNCLALLDICLVERLLELLAVRLVLQRLLICLLCLEWTKKP